MGIYFLKSTLCLALLLAFYHLILEREKMHKFNRFYLLGSVLFSFLAPLYIIHIEASSFQLIETTYEPTLTTNQIIIEEVPEKIAFDYTSILLGCYVLISAIFAIRFLRNLYKINKKIKNNTSVTLPNATLILVDDPIVPHSFWKSIFINKDEYQENKLEPELLTHELTHVTQKHTFDVLFLEILLIIFWINPLFIFLKRAIQLNHEFLADEKVITTFKNTFQYQHLLLSKAAWNNEYYLASNLNYALTKKRLKMMTTQNSKSTILLKKLAVIPLLIGFIFLFAQRVEAQEVIEVIEEEVPFQENNFIYITDKNGKKIRVNLNEFSEKEINYLKENPNAIQSIEIDGEITEIFEIPKNLIDNEKVIEEIIEEIPLKEIKELSTKENRINNIRINSLNIIVPKKGTRNQNEKDSIKFNKAWFIIIDKEKYYYTFNKNERIARYYKNGKLVNLDIVKEYKKKHKIFTDLQNKGKHYVLKSRNEQLKIDTEFSDLGGMYFRMSRANKNKVPFPKNPIKPYIRLRKGNKIWYKKFSELTGEEKLLLPPPPIPANATKVLKEKYKKAYETWKKRTGNDLPVPPKPKKSRGYQKKDSIPNKRVSKSQIKEYKRLLAAGKKSNIYKQKDVEKMQEIYLSMSKKQKKTVESVFDIVPPPPPKPDWVYTYQRLAHRINRTAKNRKANLIYLKEIYNKKMNEEERKKVTTPDEVFSYKVIEVKEKPNDFKNQNEEIIEVAEKNYSFSELKNETKSDKNTKFYIDGQKISKSDIYKLNPNKIKAININNHKKEKTVYVFTHQQKKEIKTSFMKVLNNGNNAVITKKEFSEKRQKAISKMSEEEKKNYGYRNLILLVASKNESKIVYQIDNKSVSNNAINNYIIKNPTSSIKAKSNKDGSYILSFSESKKNQMNYNDLQTIYTKVSNMVK